MDKIKVAVIGLGNIGKAACDSVMLAEDMELCGIVRRNAVTGETYGGIRVTDNIKSLGTVNVALLACPSASVAEMAEKYLSMGINTVDCFDIHNEIWDLRSRLDTIAKSNGAVSITAAGWDPGSDSMIRAIFLALAPKGITFTNFGPGMSMGHTVAVKSIKGVKSALSLTIPAGAGTHERVVYVETEQDADFDTVAHSIKESPYFIHDKTTVIKTDNVDGLLDKGHGVNIARKGVSGAVHNQLLEFNMRINNPALTAQIMVSCARASVKQAQGCYTTLELPIINLLPGSRESIIKELV